MLLRGGLVLLRSSLMLRCCRFRRAFCVRGSSLTLWLCSWFRGYGFDFRAGRLGFCSWLSGSSCVVRRRSSMFGRRFCSRLVLSRLVLA